MRVLSPAARAQALIHTPPVEKPFLYLARIVCLAIPPLLEVVADVADGATVVVGVGGLEIAVSAPAAKKPA